MGFGSTAKKLQKVTDYAEQLYERFEKLREEVDELRVSVEDTNDRVTAVQREVAEQRAVVEALAEQQGVDVESAVADVDVDIGDEAAENGDGQNGDGQNGETGDDDAPAGSADGDATATPDGG